MDCDAVANRPICLSIDVKDKSAVVGLVLRVVVLCGDFLESGYTIRRKAILEIKQVRVAADFSAIRLPRHTNFLILLKKLAFCVFRSYNSMHGK